VHGFSWLRERLSPPGLGQSGLAVPTADVVRVANRAIMIEV
jgi:hypothetical protein